MRVFSSAKKIQQGRNSFYLVVMTMEELIDHAVVDYYNPTTDEGYQRIPTKSRVDEARAYITKKRDSTFPLTIVANIRSPDVIDYDEDEGILSIPDDETIYIIDGQHRFEALRTAIEDEGFDKLKEFQVAVSLFNFNDELREALEFLVINKTAKAVRTDLAERIITLAYDDKSKREQLSLEAAGPMKKLLKDAEYVHTLTKIVDAMNLDEDSFWFEKIRLPNAPKGSSVVSQRTFTQSLKKFSKTPAFDELENEDITQAINNYWDAIEDICEYTTTPGSNSILLKTTGVYVMNQVFAFVVGKIRIRTGKYRLTKDEFRKYLTAAESYVSDDFWDTKGAAGMYGTSAKSFDIITKMITNLMDDDFVQDDEDKESSIVEL